MTDRAHARALYRTGTRAELLAEIRAAQRLITHVIEQMPAMNVPFYPPLTGPLNMTRHPVDAVVIDPLVARVLYSTALPEAQTRDIYLDNKVIAAMKPVLAQHDQISQRLSGAGAHVVMQAKDPPAAVSEFVKAMMAQRDQVKTEINAKVDEVFASLEKEISCTQDVCSISQPLWATPQPVVQVTSAIGDGINGVAAGVLSVTDATVDDFVTQQFQPANHLLGLL